MAEMQLQEESELVRSVKSEEAKGLKLPVAVWNSEMCEDRSLFVCQCPFTGL